MSTWTYNYDLAKWLDDKPNPLSHNQHTITDVYQFAQEIRGTEFGEKDQLVSYDVSLFFTNVPLDDTIRNLADKAFEDNWFYRTHNLEIGKTDLVQLLNVATKDQLFQCNGLLYEQIDALL